MPNFPMFRLTKKKREKRKKKLNESKIQNITTQANIQNDRKSTAQFVLTNPIS